MAIFLLLSRHMRTSRSDEHRAGVLAPVQAMLKHTTEIANSFGRRAALHELQHQIVNRLVPFQLIKGMTATAGDRQRLARCRRLADAIRYTAGAARRSVDPRSGRRSERRIRRRGAG